MFLLLVIQISRKCFKLLNLFIKLLKLFTHLCVKAVVTQKNAMVFSEIFPKLVDIKLKIYCKVIFEDLF